MTAQRLARRLVRPRRDRCRDAKARLRSVADPPVGRPSAHLEADAVAGAAHVRSGLLAQRGVALV